VNRIAFGLLFSLILGSVGCPPARAAAPTLTLKWQKAGCLDGEWCDTGWYCVPGRGRHQPRRPAGGRVGVILDLGRGRCDRQRARADPMVRPFVIPI
jgi:hypothetical protein